MGARFSRRKKGYEVGDTPADQAEAVVGGVLEATTEAANKVSAQVTEGAATATQEVSSTLEATAEAAVGVVKEAIAAVSEGAKAEEAVAESQEVAQEVVSAALPDVPVPSAEITNVVAEAEPAAEAPAEPAPEEEPAAAEEPAAPEAAAEPEPAEAEPAAPEPAAETEAEPAAPAAPEDADPPAETAPGLLAEIEAEVTSTAAAVSDLISTSASGAEEAAGTEADGSGAPSEDAAVENGDCEIPDSCAGPAAALEQSGESQEQVPQPAVDQLAEECLNGIGLPPVEQTDCELKKDCELPEAIGELGEAVSGAVNQVVDLV
ncbi:fibrous sheath CABYR-binding protein-like [Conger conger]|uniref:fibrous sheath CABYR-binding protein-like n=1 Tax=Conger conger TaxID=82655 RepID=UPI002A5A5E1B|nr:fibrous sheath CABYR-binding protein-like [Conger conger]